MMKEIFKQSKPAICLLLIMMFFVAFVYIGTITFLAQWLFPKKANGSLIILNNKALGSELIGQYFSDDKYFWGRPSATKPFPYNAEKSASSNLGPTNPALVNAIRDRIANLKKSDPDNLDAIPIDLVTASAGGLDAEISPLSAYCQVHRIARARRFDDHIVRQIVDAHIKERQFNFLGERRVNVLELNLALDKLKKGNHGRPKRKTS